MLGHGRRQPGDAGRSVVGRPAGWWCEECRPHAGRPRFAQQHNITISRSTDARAQENGPLWSWDSPIPLRTRENCCGMLTPLAYGNRAIGEDRIGERRCGTDRHGGSRTDAWDCCSAESRTLPAAWPIAGQACGRRWPAIGTRWLRRSDNLGLNLLVVDPAGESLFQLGQMVKQFLQAGRHNVRPA